MLMATARKQKGVYEASVALVEQQKMTSLKTRFQIQISAILPMLVASCDASTCTKIFHPAKDFIEIEFLSHNFMFRIFCSSATGSIEMTRAII